MTRARRIQASPPPISAGEAAALRRDAARADVGIEERHRRAAAMVERFKRYESLEATIVAALNQCEPFALDDENDKRDVADRIIAAIRASADGAFLRELLGDEPADRMTRMHAHGALFERATQAAWRLAGGQ